MAENKTEGADLKKLVKLGKRQSLSFAYCPGPKGDDTVLIDRRKPPEMLGKLAKKDGGGTKVAFGTFVVSGKNMELTCARTVPAMAKSLKKYLKSQKTVVNVVIMDAGGNVLESDVEDLPNDPEFEADDATPTPDAAPQEQPDAVDNDQQAHAQGGPNAADLVARVKSIQPAIAAAPAAVAAKLNKAVAMAVSQIKSGTFDLAEKTISAVEGAVANLKPEPAADTPPHPPAPQAPAAAAQPAQPDLRALVARANEVKQVIAGFSGPVAEKLGKALANAAGQIKAGELKVADTLLGRIETAVNKVMADQPQTVASAQGEEQAEDQAEDQAPPPEAAKWDAAQGRLQPAVDKLMAEKRGDLDAINRAFNYAKDQAAEGNYASALKAAAKTAELIKQAALATGTAAAQEAAAAAPVNVVEFVKSRLNWIKSRENLKAGLLALKSAIDSQTTGIEGLEAVQARSKILLEPLDAIDGDLEDTLEQLIEAPEGPGRDGLKVAARGQIDAYRTVLDTDFFKDVDNNSFVKTDIRANALNSLNQVSAALDG